MNEILDAANELQCFLVKQKWEFCFIGGIAVLRWGSLRTTQDVDVSLFVEFGKEKQTITQLLQHFEPRIDDADRFALESKVVLVASSQGIPFDIALAQFDFERKIIQRASKYEYADTIELLTVSAEDLIVMKAFAGREQDWADVEGIVAAQENLDQSLILDEFSQLAELMPDGDSREKLRKLLQAN